jgi:Cell division protein CrgA
VAIDRLSSQMRDVLVDSFAVAPPKKKGGRVTPKGGAPAAGVPTAGTPRPSGSGSPVHATTPSSRYTPPIPKTAQASPPWLPVLMFALLAVGVLLIIFNYLELLPGATSNWYLLGGLGAILGGIGVATQYR